MSYNILSGSVNFEGSGQGSIEDIVDKHSTQTITGAKTFAEITASNGVRFTGLTSGGAISSKFLALDTNNHLVLTSSGGGGGGGGISMDGSTANGVLTFLNTDTASVESGLTYDGSSLSVTGHVTASSYVGHWSGSVISGSKIQTGTAITDSTGLSLTTSGLSAQSNPPGTSKLIIDEGGTLKTTTISQAVAGNQSITNASALGNTGRVLLDGGVGTIATDAGITYDSAGNKLSVGNEVSTSVVSASTILHVGDSIKRVGEPTTAIVFGPNTMQFESEGAPILSLNGNLVPRRRVQISGAAGDAIFTPLAGADFYWSGSTGRFGFGATGEFTHAFHIVTQSNQFKIGYDQSNAASFDVASNGDLTINGAGTTTIANSFQVNANTTLGDNSGDSLTINGATITANNGPSITCNNGITFDTNTLVVSSSNNRVGILTTSPEESLHVSGSCWLGNNPGVPGGSGVGGTPQLYIAPEFGRVGIATNNPVVRFHVSSSANSINYTRVQTHLQVGLSPGEAMLVDSETQKVRINNNIGVPNSAFLTASLEIHSGSGLNPGPNLRLHTSLQNTTASADIYMESTLGDLVIHPSSSNGSGGRTIIKNDLIIQEKNNTDTVVHLFDSSDDGVLAANANNQRKLLLHANGHSYFNGGNVTIGAESTYGQYEGETLNVSGTLNVSSSVYLGAPNLAPTDSKLQNGQISFYLDESGNNLKVRVKYSNGTLKTATISLV